MKTPSALPIAMIAFVICQVCCAPAWGQASKYKAVWEPVNFKSDLMLYDVYFVNDDTGWAVGGAGELSGGVILHTGDGGVNWTVQLGDPQSSDAAIQSLRFIDATHGWAVQDVDREPRLLHTDDGKTWTQSGSLPRHFSDYTFTSLRHGILADGAAELLVTDDGGNSWKRTGTCEVQAEVEGLTRHIACAFRSLYFPNSTTGYAVGSSEALTKGFALFKTVDGGATWQSSVIPSEPGSAEDVFFIDEFTGYVRIGYPDTGLLYRTADGGKTWNRTAASPGKSIRFADPEIGWAFHYSKLSFTTSGGTAWTSRTFSFPGRVDAFSLPSRHRAYVAGTHGMVYRYSIVPIGYSAKGMLDAPMMPQFELAIDAHMEKIRRQIKTLKARMEHAATTPSGIYSAQSMQYCCAAELENLGTSFVSLRQAFPALTARYRSLNLPLDGKQRFSDLTAKLDGAGASFAAMKSAATPEAAAAAVRDFSLRIDEMAQSAYAAGSK